MKISDNIKTILGIDIKKELDTYTIIGNNVTFEGKITKGNLYIEGKFIPSTYSEFEKLQIAYSGIFCSDNDLIHIADTVEIVGTFSGNIEANNVFIRTGAIVSGSITYKNQLICEKDVVINATINIIN